jgi:hypothetical protein
MAWPARSLNKANRGNGQRLQDLLHAMRGSCINQSLDIIQTVLLHNNLDINFLLIDLLITYRVVGTLKLVEYFYE